MIYVSVNSKDIITSISKRPFKIDGQKTFKLDKDYGTNLIGKKIPKYLDNGIRLAIICNWEDQCGIATYTKFLVDALTPKVGEIKIFAENYKKEFNDPRAIGCWKRGESMAETINKIKKWNPDIVLIQHEFGIFPRANHFLKMLQSLEEIPYVITLHSVYEHLDKAVCTSPIKNMIVHTKEAEDMLKKLGNSNNISVIPHGCIPMNNNGELWNTFQNPYTIFQFGFGFFYKGVEVAIDAIHYLKNNDPKFKDIFYCYLCSQSNHAKNIHSDYYEHLCKKIHKLGLEENVAILTGYFSDIELENYLRTMKLAIFPYVTDPNNTVYGASGAVRIAMASGTPVIASKSHLFDDLEGIIPRTSNHIELAKEIDEMFSCEQHKNLVLHRTKKFVKSNSWENVADQYVETFINIIQENRIEEKGSFWQKFLSFFE